ncbi:single-stranded-DNA-specific exonuclease RecJ [Paenibacillus sp. GCM10027626]|uniref:single-stranded-DNA-specific exonuclease RecJ n=1 Tax=Paenibacillus sp. GCM10027626 TaxID=3273411 RepID=UPI00362F9D49
MKEGDNLLQARTRWDIAALDEAGNQEAELLSRTLGVPLLIAKLLVQRGYGEPQKAKTFLHGGLECLHDPFMLKGMREAVERIELARAAGERVRIYGDYDADGVSSTTLMTCLFQRLELQFDHYIPHRSLEGYGLNNKAIDLAAEAGVTLLVTVDTGISAVTQIDYARERGIDVIVTDHHEPPAVLPKAAALINPKLPDCPYPFKGLAGVGVAFKLAQALLGEPPIEWTDIVALGTIADLMPLADENRVLVRYGIERLRQSDKPGFRALAEVAGIDLHTITATNVAFGMAPRINAAGRLEHADRAVALLTAIDEEKASSAAISLDMLNRERQRVVEAIVKEAEAIWEAKCAEAAAAGKLAPAVVVLAGEGWNVGVVGIVASKFVEKLYKPVLILGIDPETGMSKGSARSIDGFDLHAALTACEELLDHYGGHQAAAGMSLQREKLPALEERLSELARQWLQPEDWIPKTTVDLTCTIEEASLAVLEQLSLLEPFGAGNTAPKLMLSGTTIADYRTMGKEKNHLKLTLSAQGLLLDGVGFGLGMAAERISNGAGIELVGELSLNEWNGRKKAQFMIQDLRIKDVQLIDQRDVSPLTAFKQLLADQSLISGGALVVVPDQVWRDALLAAAQKAAGGLPPSLVISTYDELEERLELAGNSLVLCGRPKSADRLIALLQQWTNLERVYACYNRSHQLEEGRGAGVGRRQSEAGAFPDRAAFGQLYQTMRRVCPLEGSGYTERLTAMMGWPGATISFMLRVFAELELVSAAENGLRLPAAPKKRDLSESETYRRARRTAEVEQILFADTAQLAQWIIEQKNAAPMQSSTYDIKQGVAIS